MNSELQKNISVYYFFSVWAQPEGTIQTEAESSREEEQPNAQEKRWKYHDSLQEEGSGANGYVRYSMYSICWTVFSVTCAENSLHLVIWCLKLKTKEKVLYFSVIFTEPHFFQCSSILQSLHFHVRQTIVIRQPWPYTLNWREAAAAMPSRCVYVLCAECEHAYSF